MNRYPSARYITLRVRLVGCHDVLRGGIRVHQHRSRSVLIELGAGRSRMPQGGVVVAELALDSAEEVEAVYAALRGVPGIRVDATAATPAQGEQGTALELLTVALSGGAVTAFLQIVKTLVDSRGPGFVLKVRRGRDRLEVTADNTEQALAALREVLGGPS